MSKSDELLRVRVENKIIGIRRELESHDTELWDCECGGCKRNVDRLKVLEGVLEGL